MGNLFSKDPFRAVQTWDDLLQVNILFLEGKIWGTPYHHGPLEPDSVPLMGKLVALHRYGFFSINGQGSLVNEWERQRSFITGFLSADHAEGLANYFQKHRKSFVGRILYLRRQAGSTYLKNDLYYSDARLNERTPYNLTQTRSRKDMVWRFFTNFPTTDSATLDEYGYESSLFGKYPNIMSLLVDNLFVEVAAVTYGRGSTEDFLLKYFKNAK